MDAKGRAKKAGANNGANVRSHIELEIKHIIEQSGSPVSTNEIASRLSRSWHTIERHCLEMKLDGKLNGFKIGKTNAWMLNK